MTAARRRRASSPGDVDGGRHSSPRAKAQGLPGDVSVILTPPLTFFGWDAAVGR